MKSAATVCADLEHDAQKTKHITISAFAEIIGVLSMSSEHGVEAVSVGTWVKVLEVDSGDEEVFHIVEPREANYLENKIPPDNPMGRVLLGSKPGEEVVLDGPTGTVKFSILEIGRA
jgi:transcription elongation factor GreA